MHISRRRFLYAVGSGCLLAGSSAISCLRQRRKDHDLPSADLTEVELADLAIRTLKQKGVEYADVRICKYRHQEIEAEDLSFKRLTDTESYGFGIRVLHRGAWGFAASNILDAQTVREVAATAQEIAIASASLRSGAVALVPAEVHRAEWSTPFRLDPFEVPLSEKCALAMAITEKLRGVDGINRTEVRMSFDDERKLFASTEGALIRQRIVRSEPSYEAYATAGGDTQSRSFESYPLNAGYEHVLECGLLESAERIADEAVEKVKAAEGPAGVPKDLILAPSHLWLTIHETVGHPTELDRVLGYEANYAGTSFATPEGLGKLRYGSEIVNFVADRTIPRGRSTVGYDDEGGAAGRWDIVRRGILVGYSTNRETAAKLGLARSTGCAYADSWRSVPIIRIPNLNLQPGGPGAPSLEDLIADTRDGILIDGSGNYSIDQQRRNFQFGGNAFWEIRNGKRTRMLKGVTYHAMTTDFWGACDAICNESEFRLYGTSDCGKGEPNQTGQMSTGSAPARFRGIEVGGSKA